MATEDGSEYFNIDFLNKDCKTINVKLILKAFQSVLKNAQYTDFFYYKLSRSLRYVDRASMRYGVEARVPFWIMNLLNFALVCQTSIKWVTGNKD